MFLVLLSFRRSTWRSSSRRCSTATSAPSPAPSGFLSIAWSASWRVRPPSGEFVLAARTLGAKNGA
ncbi:MAG: hypothetical protein R2697_16200 [Ilumatobacteraceae bacterium]